MDISKWGWGQLLELPDHLFGRRYCIGCSVTAIMQGVHFDISETPLPEKSVIWCVHAQHGSTILSIATVSFALGDFLPTVDAEFDQFEQLIPDIGIPVGTRRDIHFGNESPLVLCAMKVGVSTQGRRLVMRAHKTAQGTQPIDAALIVSSVPRSIPEWYG